MIDDIIGKIYFHSTHLLKFYNDSESGDDKEEDKEEDDEYDDDEGEKRKEKS
ncbi:hypothetical protein RhiirA4_473344 [Rhizophagus irregularis]|uniref:Uncharacterized protein n=1 Tax=Rhizophagus irregularis TaxID=588596 RepID=A0A2I1H6J5_9GLOM|nr:hypothetical protein RhiirA4_473344 [Rhizophagus irregularis]